MSTVTKRDTLTVRFELDVVKARQVVRAWMAELTFGLVDQTKMITAASELARNMIIYGGGGEMMLEAVADDRRQGLRLTFADEGPGIADLAQAMTDGYTTGSGLGLGLSGSKRLVNDFVIDTAPGAGTRVVITRWK